MMCECENGFGDGAKVFHPLLEENGNKDKKERQPVIFEGWAKVKVKCLCVRVSMCPHVLVNESPLGVDKIPGTPDNVLQSKYNTT